MLARVSCSDTATQSFSSRKSLQSTTSQRSTQQRQRLWQSLTQPTPCAKQNDPRPVVVELQAITGHPIANAFKAAGEAFNCFLARGRWYTDIQLCIVCIRATGETEPRHNVKQPRHVQQRLQRSTPSDVCSCRPRAQPENFLPDFIQDPTSSRTVCYARYGSCAVMASQTLGYMMSFVQPSSQS